MKYYEPEHCVKTTCLRQNSGERGHITPPPTFFQHLSHDSPISTGHPSPPAPTHTRPPSYSLSTSLLQRGRREKDLRVRHGPAEGVTSGQLGVCRSSERGRRRSAPLTHEDPGGCSSFFFGSAAGRTTALEILGVKSRFEITGVDVGSLGSP